MNGPDFVRLALQLALMLGGGLICVTFTDSGNIVVGYDHDILASAMASSQNT